MHYTNAVLRRRPRSELGLCGRAAIGAKLEWATAFCAAVVLGGGCAKPSCEETLTCPRQEGGAGASAGAAGTEVGRAASAGAAGAGGTAASDPGSNAGRDGSANAKGGEAGAARDSEATGGAAGESSKSENAGGAGAGSNIDDCESAPCLHGGVCKDSVNAYSCDCEGTAHFGERCEIAHFEWIGPSGARALAVSADGKVVVGSLDGVPARWTAETGLEKLRALAEPVDSGMAWAVSADGSVIAGFASLSSGAGAFRWTAATGMVSLHLSPDSDVYGMSADGSSMAGSMRPGGGTTARHAFRWTQSAGTEDLGEIGSSAWVASMSGDGTIIIGYSYDDGPRSFRWTRSTGVSWLPMKGIARDISGDGKTIVGEDGELGGSFIYTEDDGVSHLDTGDLDARAFTVNDDGSVIGGYTQDVGWVWDRSRGFDFLPDLVRAQGADPDDFTGIPYGVSADGHVLAGGRNYDDPTFRPWIARF